MGWLTAFGEFFKTIGIALGIIKREEEKKEDFQIARGADLEATVKEQQSAQVTAENVHKLSRDQLVDELRDTGSGRS